MINAVIWLIAGGVIGAVASVATGATARPGLLLDILVGSVSAFLVGLFLTPFFDRSIMTHSSFNLPAMLVSSLGTIILLMLFHLPTYFSVRSRKSTEARRLSRRRGSVHALVQGEN